MVHISGQHRYGGSHVSLTKHDYLVMSLIIIFTPIVLWIGIKIIQRLFYQETSKSKTRLLRKSSIKKRRKN